MSFDLKNGWFYEVNDQWKGVALGIEVEEVLFDQKSLYQHVVVFKSKALGNVLVLDGVIQITEFDESAYQEPIAHIPLFSHPNPKRVLVVGGGDGGVLREALKHDSVEELVICEIDQMVIDCARKYFPKISASYDHPKVKLICGDASVYIKDEKNAESFDVIIADTSDPVGPAAALFERPFYHDLWKALRWGGKLATQGESLWFHLDMIADLVSEVKAMNIYESVEYATTQIPTYPMGQIGFIVCSKPKSAEDKPDYDNMPSLKEPVRQVDDESKFHFYNSDIHRAAFVLPNFVRRALNAKK